MGDDMNTWLTVTEQGTKRMVPGDVTPAQSTQLARIDPDAVVRDVLSSQTATVTAYLRNVATAQQNSAAPQRNDAPYSSEPELRARNRRFYVSIAAYVALSALVVWGLVKLATLAGMLAGDWWLASWLAGTGIVALWLVRWTHAGELHHTPEGLAHVTAAAAAYATETDADARRTVADAVADAIRARASAELAEYGQRIDATAAWLQVQRTPTPDDAAMVTYGSTLPAAPIQERRFAVSWQTEHQTGTQGALQAQGDAPQRAMTCSTPTPDAGAVAFIDVIRALYADAQRTGDNLVTQRLPWSQRGDWHADAKRRAIAVLDTMEPPLLVAGAGGRWRLNVAEWPQAIAESAILRRWRRL